MGQAGEGRREGPAAVPSPSRLPALLVALGVPGTVAAGWLVSFRAGGAVLALTLLGAALLRLLLPVARAGTLAVRSRGVDVATLLAMAAAVAFLAQNAPG